MSTKQPASSEPRAVADTVVLRYLLFVDRLDLLLDLVGRPLLVPRVVFDPDEEDPPDLMASEVLQSIRYQRRVTTDPARDEATRGTASENASALERMAGAYGPDGLRAVDMDAEERRLASSLTSPSGCGAFGLILPLGAGEAACIAIAVQRGLCLVTDDGDALKALRSMEPALPYDRIRRLLIRAADERRIMPVEANALHDRMRQRGFYDVERPFPDADR